MNINPDDVADIAARAHIASWGGVGGSAFGFIFSDVGIMLMSLVVAALGTVATIYFRWERRQREATEHELKMDVLARRGMMFDAVTEVMEAVNENPGAEPTERQRVALQALREVEYTETEIGGFEGQT